MCYRPCTCVKMIHGVLHVHITMCIDLMSCFLCTHIGLRGGNGGISTVYYKNLVIVRKKKK